MTPESLIFDIDGTLWDSRELVARGYNRYLDRIGHPELHVTPEYLKNLFGKTMTEIADCMLTPIPREDRLAILEGCTAEEHDVLENDPCDIAFPGVVETLKQLKKDYRLFIVSNSQLGYPELLMRKLGVTDLFEGHLCFGNTGTCKGETLKALIKQHRIGSCVYLGDTQGDLEACELANVPFIFCSYGFGHPRRWDAKLDSFSRLPQLLTSL